MLTPAALGLRRLDWPELVHAAMSVQTERSAQRFGALALGTAGGEDTSPRGTDGGGGGTPGHGADADGTPGHGADARPGADADADRTSRPEAAPEGDGAGAATLGTLLDAIDAGALWRIAERLPRSAEAAAAHGRAAREFARPQLRAGLSQLVSAEYLRQGRARWQLSWAESAALELPYGHVDELPAALEAAVADRPDTGPLRALLEPVAAPETSTPAQVPAPGPTA